VTGLPRFDLSRWNPEYFERLRSRVAEAGERGIYVAVMLFEGWSTRFSPGAASHPFLANNNINGLDGVSDPGALHTLRYPEVTARQRKYVRKVVETLADQDNVLYEVANEAAPESTAWQYEMIRYVRCLEAHQARRHPVGMTYQYRGGYNATLFASGADWVSPGAEPGHYLTAPEPADGSQVIIADTDHLGGSGFSDVDWVWRSFFRGLNLLYMDRYVGDDSVAREAGSLVAARLRAAIGSARVLADGVGIGRFLPSRDVASTSFALVAEDAILVLSPDDRRFTVDLRDRTMPFAVEWLDVSRGLVLPGSNLAGGQTVALRAPFRDGAILYLRRPDATGLVGLQPQFRAVNEAALAHTGAWAWPRQFLDPYRGGLRQRGGLMAAALAISFALGLGLGLALMRLAWLRRR
jgi:hypothetical protein